MLKTHAYFLVAIVSATDVAYLNATGVVSTNSSVTSLVSLASHNGHVNIDSIRVV